jgi:periplasmic divalent cation tolerance protein
MEQLVYAVVLVTVSGKDEAEKLTGILLENRKAACVNIVTRLQSHYWWHGKIENAGELLLIVKTRISLVPEVIKMVKAAHSYTVPEIIALPIIDGNKDYLEWIGGETRE